MVAVSNPKALIFFAAFLPQFMVPGSTGGSGFAMQLAVFGGTDSSTRDKLVSNIKEIQARGGTVMSVVTDDDTTVERVSDYIASHPTAALGIAAVLDRAAVDDVRRPGQELDGAAPGRQVPRPQQLGHRGKELMDMLRRQLAPLVDRHQLPGAARARLSTSIRTRASSFSTTSACRCTGPPAAITCG